MFLMIDNYDSFVYNLVRYFEELDEQMIVYRNDKITLDDIISINPLGIIISPGPKKPSDNAIPSLIIKTFKETIPILGICLGHQYIAKVFGAKIIKGKQPKHGKLSTITHDGLGLYKNIKNNIQVTHYHSLVVDKDTLPNDLLVTSKTNEDVIMGIRHKYYAVEGVQFHPEAVLTEYGHDMLYNFINLCKEKRGVII